MGLGLGVVICGWGGEVVLGGRGGGGGTWFQVQLSSQVQVRSAGVFLVLYSSTHVIFQHSCYILALILYSSTHVIF